MEVAAIPTYSLEKILTLHPDYFPAFLRALKIPASSDNRGQIAVALNRLGKLSYPPLNGNLETLIAQTGPVNRYNLIYQLDAAAAVAPVSTYTLRQIMSMNDTSVREFMEDLRVKPSDDERGDIAMKLLELGRLTLPDLHVPDINFLLEQSSPRYINETNIALARFGITPSADRYQTILNIDEMERIS